MILSEAQSKVGPGWSKLISKYYDQISFLSEWHPEVIEVKNRIGMLNIQATCTPMIETIQQILNSLSWTIERESAKVCEVCGNKGFRRKALPNSPNRCQQHYVELMNQQG